jgi:hypothetical protein
MGARLNHSADFGEMSLHGLGVAPGHDGPCALAQLWADDAEDIGRLRALVMWCPGRVPRRAQRRVVLFFCPIRASSWNQISIAVPGASRCRMLSSLAGNFLKASMASGSCA